MEYILAFLISVLASIVGYYICKWLDRDKRQHYPDGVVLQNEL